jgi:hypothetical protein
MLKHAQDAELSLLVYQRVVGDNGEIEVQTQETRIDVITSFC